MFSFFSVSKVKSLMKRVAFSGMALLILAAALGSCDSNSGNDANAALQGKWVGDYDETYIIGETTLQYSSGFDDFDYKGNITSLSTFGSDSGVVIFQYTELPKVKADISNIFSAVYYRNLKRDSVQLANVINLTDYSSVDTASLEEAAAKFTRADMGSYVDWSFVQPLRKE